MPMTTTKATLHKSVIPAPELLAAPSVTASSKSPVPPVVSSTKLLRLLLVRSNDAGIVRN